jgi:hypothetical protein
LLRIAAYIENSQNEKLHFDVKLAQELFDAKLTIGIIFLDVPGEGSTQVVIGFRMWLTDGILMLLMI